MSDTSDLQELRQTLKRRLAVLNNQVAALGKNFTPADKLIEIEDLEQQIARLERQIQQQPAPHSIQEALYRQQMAKLYREIGLEGIPGVAERRTLTVQEIFVELQTERTNDDVNRELLRIYRQAENASDKEMIRLQRVRNRLVHAAASAAKTSIEETLHSLNRVVILGDPGAGKTTLLKYLTVTCATSDPAEVPPGLRAEDESVLLPIFVSLGEFATETAERRQDYNLIDYLYTNARERLMLAMPPGFFEAALEAGRCLVCLDGLDEIWSITQRKTVCDAVKALVNRFPKSYYVVTSRIIGYEDAPLDSRDFVHRTVMPLTNDSIRRFVEQWYELREINPVRRQRQVAKLLKTLERQPRIQTLARNPLLLTIITLVHHIETDLPLERVKLYDICVTTLIEKWDESKGLVSDENQALFQRYRRWLLERLAYALHIRSGPSGQVQTVKEGDLEHLLMGFLREKRQLDLADDPAAARDAARAFIRIVRSRTGLLIERGNGVFGFPHLTFQEYLAACDIENRSMYGGEQAIWDEIQPHIRESHWREIILLLLGKLNKYEDLASRIIERILDSGASARFDSVFHYQLYLAARALADRVDVTLKVRRRIIGALLAIAQSQRQWQREDAFAALGALLDDRYVAESLLAILRDQQLDIGIRADAARAFGQSGLRGELIDALLALANDPETDAWVRRAVIMALGQVGRAPEQIGPTLLDLAYQDELDTEVRRAAIMVAAQVGHADDRILNQLRTLAANLRIDPSIRLTTAVMLGQSGYASSAMEVLIDMIGSATIDIGLRSEAARALGQIGSISPQVVTTLVLIALNRTVPTEIRIEATRALGQIGRGDEEITRKLLTLAHLKQANIEIRCVAAMTLGRGKHAQVAVDLLLALGANQNRETPLYGLIIRALRKIGRDTLLEDSVRFAAAEALQQLERSEEMIDVLLEIGRSRTDEAVRERAAAILIEQAQSRQIDEKVKVKVRQAAAEALSQLERNDEAAKIFYQLANNRNLDSSERYAAATELAHVGSLKEAMDVLLELATNQRVNTGVRRNSLFQLLQLARNPATDEGIRDQMVAALRQLAESDTIDAEIRLIAAGAIARIGLAAISVEVLYTLWDKGVSLSVRREATSTLLRLVRDRAVTPEVRQAAADYLCTMGRAEKTVKVFLELLADRRADEKLRRRAGQSLVGLVRDPKVGTDVRREALAKLKLLVTA
ncbi:MAG TPA: HEAT repeat domain-containing protein [Kouleothrix sp.]|uniref:HEAT repeat domain-containing protein n=1 Tax=Kouleothrix sp. TaxID=2779161 RepID=UPI002CE6471E|nr:HEAT repeat domain-containing protein [Kouleothrix sp.]HRC74648.1 HEAT repeat domain-containing protein [Kouleothrix sp.]